MLKIVHCRCGIQSHHFERRQIGAHDPKRQLRVGSRSGRGYHYRHYMVVQVERVVAGYLSCKARSPGCGEQIIIMLYEIKRNLTEVVDRLRGEIVNCVQNISRVQSIMVWNRSSVS